MTAKHPRKTSLGKLAAGALVAVGMVMAAGSSAMADSWKHNNGHGRQWPRQQALEAQQPLPVRRGHGGYYYQPRPKVVYVQPRPRVVYVQPQPVYVAPPPVYYYQPAPVYRRPEINIVFPLDFD